MISITIATDFMGNNALNDPSQNSYYCFRSLHPYSSNNKATFNITANTTFHDDHSTPLCSGASTGDMITTNNEPKLDIILSTKQLYRIMARESIISIDTKSTRERTYSLYPHDRSGVRVVGGESTCTLYQTKIHQADQ